MAQGGNGLWTLHKLQNLQKQLTELLKSTLDKKVFYKYPKVYSCKLNIKRDIRVEKIKVKILVINLLSSQYKEFRHVLYLIEWGKMQAIF